MDLTNVFLTCNMTVSKDTAVLKSDFSCGPLWKESSRDCCDVLWMLALVVIKQYSNNIKRCLLLLLLLVSFCAVLTGRRSSSWLMKLRRAIRCIWKWKKKKCGIRMNKTGSARRRAERVLKKNSRWIEQDWDQWTATIYHHALLHYTRISDTSGTHPTRSHLDPDPNWPQQANWLSTSN